MKLFSVFFICIFFSMQLLGQENNVQNKITLNTGEIYIGKVLLKNDEMIMISTKDGTRYQFPLSEIKKVESTGNESKFETDNGNQNNHISNNFGGLIELSGGTASAKNSFGWAPNTQLSLMFGNKHLFGQQLFLGIGVGYNSSYITSNSISFLPLFLHIQSTLSKKRTAAFLGMDAGYAFAISKNYDGGALVKISGGISHKLSYKTTLIGGIYTGVQSFSGSLTEINDLGTFNYYGRTSMITTGVKIGFLF